MSTVFHVDFKNKKLVEKQSDGSPEAEIKPDVVAEPMSKKDYFAKLIDSGLVQILVNPKVRSTKLPADLKSNLYVALNWSYKFNIDDFAFDDKGVKGTLSFNSKSFFVNVPWKSIWAIFLPKSPKESMKIWEADVPKEISLSEFVHEDK